MHGHFPDRWDGRISSLGLIEEWEKGRIGLSPFILSISYCGASRLYFLLQTGAFSPVQESRIPAAKALDLGPWTKKMDTRDHNQVYPGAGVLEQKIA